jgi:hypothetical protein
MAGPSILRMAVPGHDLRDRGIVRQLAADVKATARSISMLLGCDAAGPDRR